MFRRSKNPASYNDLDRLGTEIVRASVPSDEEVEKASSSPFIFERVKLGVASRNTAERPARGAGYDKGRSGFSVWMNGLRLAVAMIVVFCALGFWVLRLIPAPEGDMRAGAPAAPEARLTACSISNRDKCVISTEDVVELLASGSNQEVGK
ncbi:MAG TPA: hypothetical protein VI756_02475 [Blastocatellia bacterium]